MRGFIFMDLKKFKLTNERHYEEAFKKIASLTYDPYDNKLILGQLLIGQLMYFFSDEANEYWNQFLFKILQLKKLDNFVSIKTTDEALRPFLEIFLIDQVVKLNEISEAIIELEKFKSMTHHNYYIISGITSSSIYSFSNIKFGNFDQKCDIEKLSFYEKINANNEEIINLKKENGTFIENDYFYNLLTREIEEYKNKTVIEVANIGDKEISVAKSNKDAEHFINELIFLSSLSTNAKFDIKLHFTLPEKKIRIPLRVSYCQKSVTAPTRSISYNINFDLFSSVQNNNIGLLFKHLSFPLLSIDTHYELLEKLKIAIDWYASSIKSENHRESFLFCAIGMESLLSIGRDAITKTLAKNTAFLIAKNEKNSRKLIFLKMIELYSKRSGVVHGGNINIELRDIKQIRYYLSACITTIIFKIQSNEFNTVDDLFQFFEDQKFS